MIRAGVPKNVERRPTKLGRGANGATNDIAIMRPPGRRADPACHLFCRINSDCERSSGRPSPEVTKVVAEFL